MCACEAGWLCPRCAGTVADPAYLLNDPDPGDPWSAEPDFDRPAEFEVPGA